jgi:hypothetical protein
MWWALGIMWLIIGLIMMIPSPILGGIVIAGFVLFNLDIFLPIFIVCGIILAGSMLYSVITDSY